MKPYTVGLKNLLDHDEEAKAYFESLPLDVRNALCNEDISSMELLKAVADKIKTTY